MDDGSRPFIADPARVSRAGRDLAVQGHGRLKRDQRRVHVEPPALDAGVANFVWRGKVVLDRQATSYQGTAPDLGWYERRQ
jgi:hypothetical protein